MADDYRLFVESAAFRRFADGAASGADQSERPLPEWVPFLPVPHEYKHPRYGTISITRERNEQFVGHFKKAVWQDRLPLDAEHSYKLSGAMGWVVDMRLNPNGSVDAKVDWTPNGAQLLREGRFRYISPEFYVKWMNPATGEVFDNVATGGALTTKPFFKEPYLKQIPLVASERGFELPDGAPGLDDDGDDDEGDGTGAESGDEAFEGGEGRDEGTGATGAVRITGKAVIEVDENTLTAEQYAELTAKAARVEAAEAQVADLGRQLSEAQTQLTEQAAQILAFTEAQRERKFTDEVMGRSGESDGLRWFGDPKQHVATLLNLAKIDGEDGPAVKGYIEAQRAAAAQVKGSNIFTEVGTTLKGDEGDEGDNADAIIRRRAQKMSERDNIPVSLATVKVLESDRALYARYKQERGL